jgi:PadR family transcriptional regulator AphA
MYLADITVGLKTISVRYIVNMAENRSRYAILGALTVEPMSGYDIRQFFAETLKYFWVENYGQIYPMLKTLHAERLIKRLAKDGSSGRTSYKITPRGRRALRAWLAEPAAPQPRRNELLLKLFFARQASPGATAAQLAQFRQRHENLASAYTRIAHQIEIESAADPNLPNWLTTLSYGIRVSRALLEWCDEAERALPS